MNDQDVTSLVEAIKSAIWTIGLVRENWPEQSGVNATLADLRRELEATLAAHEGAVR